MTEPRFEELINLYLDNEIGRHELGELKHAIRDNVLRRQKFERACQLHQAARKALTSRAEGTPDTNNRDGKGGGERETNAGAAREAASSSPGRRSRVSSSGGKGWLKQKQGHAHRNAAVPTLAERQLSKGAASTVDLGKISLESSRSRPTTSQNQPFSFFDSPAGMMVAAVFTLVGVVGLYLMLRVGAPDSNEDGSQHGDSVITQAKAIDEKELLRELQGHRKGGASPAEAMSATLYQSAAGQTAVNAVETNYSMTQTTTTSGSVGGINSTPLQVTLPPVVGLPENQGLQANISLPPIIAPVGGVGNVVKPENGTPPPVNLP